MGEARKPAFCHEQGNEWKSAWAWGAAARFGDGKSPPWTGLGLAGGYRFPVTGSHSTDYLVRSAHDSSGRTVDVTAPCTTLCGRKGYAPGIRYQGLRAVRAEGRGPCHHVLSFGRCLRALRMDPFYALRAVLRGLALVVLGGRALGAQLHGHTPCPSTPQDLCVRTSGNCPPVRAPTGTRAVPAHRQRSALGTVSARPFLTTGLP